MKRVAIAAALIAGLGCGGGGGGEAENFAGVWSARFTGSSDTCNIGGLNAFNNMLTIDQNGSAVVVTFPNGATAPGVGDEDSLEASRNDLIPDGCVHGGTASVTTKVEFFRVEGESDQAAVTWTEDSHCDGSLLFCTQTWTGTATREVL